MAIEEVNITGSPQRKIPHDYSRGFKKLEDAILSLSSLAENNPRLADKKLILEAIKKNDIVKMRAISDYFYRVSGIYSRLCRYMAYLYKYDWWVDTRVIDTNLKKEKILEGFAKSLTTLESFYPKKFFSDVALTVIRKGCYYGYQTTDGVQVSIQELPSDYCRSRFSTEGRPAVEFQMKYFDTAFPDTEYRMKILNIFPNEFKKGYIAYKEGKLPPQFQGDTAGWYLLDPERAFKFNINGEDFPLLISVIPAILDLNEAQELDKRRMAQQLIKILVQKLSVDKNGELVFDPDEAQELHNNAVQMLNHAVGLDVLTTYADISVEDVADSNISSRVDELEKVERTVYNESGTAQNLFNTNGNTALEKSILNDEASLSNLIQQFEQFLNLLLKPFNKNPKKILFVAQILPTTIYNYKDYVKMYKEQTQMGYSRFLPAVALGQSQSSILSAAYFEVEVLDLPHKLIPPMTSNTMNAQALEDMQGGGSKDEKEKGRPELEDDQKSDKTLQNLESMS